MNPKEAIEKAVAAANAEKWEEASVWTKIADTLIVFHNPRVQRDIEVSQAQTAIAEASPTEGTKDRSQERAAAAQAEGAR